MAEFSISHSSSPLCFLCLLSTFRLIIGVVSIVGGAAARYGGGAMVLSGLMWILLGPIASRIYCELLIVVFSINGTLTEVRDLLKSKTSI